MKNNHSEITLEEVNFEYPYLSVAQRSLREKFINFFKNNKLLLNKKNHLLFSNLSFKARSGDRVGVVGPNGSGKTTFMKLLSGIYSPKAGTIDIKGNVTSVFELGYGTEFNLDGKHNIYRILLFFGYDKNSIQKKISDIILFSGLGDAINQPLRTYSSGMLLRLQFSAAAFIDPDIFILDEMFGTGDLEFRKKAYHKVDELVKNSKIFIFSSHYPELIERFCNRVIHIEGGQIVKDYPILKNKKKTINFKNI